MTELMFKVISVEEAKKSLVPFVKELKRKEKALKIEEALGRYTSEVITAKEDLPAFSRSTMDGFAVNASCTFGASASMPAYLDLVGEVEMGKEADFEIRPGEVAKIATGGMLPRGANAVVILENTEKLDEKTIGILKPVAPFENVIRKGEDFALGETLFEKNHLLRAQDIGALAALGFEKVKVWEPLNVGIISTGNELIKPGEKLTLGKIRDINSYSLYALTKNAGGKPKLYGIVEDKFSLLKEKVEKALAENDLVLISGGSSVGAKDYTLKVLEEIKGLKMLFHGISVKPGKPTIAAAGAGKIVFGLPGHPVSAMIAFSSLVEPILNGSLGEKDSFAKKIFLKAILTKSISSTPGREEHIRVKIFHKDDEIYAEPILGKSASIKTMVKSDGEIIIPIGKEGIKAGERVTVNLFERNE